MAKRNKLTGLALALSPASMMAESHNAHCARMCEIIQDSYEFWNDSASRSALAHVKYGSEWSRRHALSCDGNAQRDLANLIGFASKVVATPREVAV